MIAEVLPQPLVVGGRVIATDHLGYLLDPGDWEPSVAEAIAARDGLTLGDEHLGVISLVREHYEHCQMVPDVRTLLRGHGRGLGRGTGHPVLPLCAASLRLWVPAVEDRGHDHAAQGNAGCLSVERHWSPAPPRRAGALARDPACCWGGTGYNRPSLGPCSACGRPGFNPAGPGRIRTRPKESRDPCKFQTQ